MTESDGFDTEDQHTQRQIFINKVEINDEIL